MTKRHAAYLLVLAFLILTLGACASASADAPTNGQEPRSAAATAAPEGYREIDAAKLAGMLQQKDFKLINVHTPYAGEIPGTDAFVPYDKIAENLAQLPADKNASVVLYCRSGMMSDIAAKTLVQLGYTNVSSLKGGMGAWEQAGNDLLRQPQGSPTPTVQPAGNSAGGTSGDKAGSASIPAEARSSQGGNVTVEVTPAGTPGQDLVFSVALNTHMVDLSYDFRALATLRDDQGHTSSPVNWDGGRGGHHVSGKLLFSNNPPILVRGVKWIELNLKDIAGVPERTFRWDVVQGSAAQ